MSFLEKSQKHWDEMSAKERERLLSYLTPANPRPDFWEGKSTFELAKLSYDNLPNELQGNLIMAVTEEGFSVRGFRWVQKILTEVKNSTPHLPV